MVFEGLIEELFKRQIKYKAGRYWIESFFREPERMQWIGSKHLSIIQENMSKKYGFDYFIEEYFSSKLYGHIFASQIEKLIKTRSMLAIMLGMVVKRFGWGDIKVIDTEYKDAWGAFNFYDIPLSRETIKLFGKQPFPRDFMIAGLLCGSAEHLLKTKLMSFESTCLSNGDDKCTFYVFRLENIEKEVNKIKNAQYKEILKKILILEKKRDLRKEAEDLIKKQNKSALLNDADYFRKL